MAKTLDKDRPASTISDMIDESLIEQATQEAEAFSSTIEVAQAPAITSKPHIQQVGQGAAQLSSVVERTGEHTDISKMYRLTPTAAGTVQGLSRCLSSHLGYEINNSSAIRSVLRVVHEAQADIQRLASDRLRPRRQPSTAIGNEHLRDALESELAAIILAGIRACAENNPKD